MEICNHISSYVNVLISSEADKIVDTNKCKRSAVVCSSSRGDLFTYKMFHVDVYKVQYPTTLLTTVKYKFSNTWSFKDVCLYAESICYFPNIEPIHRETLVLQYSWKCIRFFEIKASVISTNTCHLVLCLRMQYSTTIKFDGFLIPRVFKLFCKEAPCTARTSESHLWRPSPLLWTVLLLYNYETCHYKYRCLQQVLNLIILKFGPIVKYIYLCTVALKPSYTLFFGDMNNGWNGHKTCY